MKHFLVILALVITFASCEKKEQKVLCPVVSLDAVPAAVVSTFHEMYPNVTADKWFNKDNIGYSALFTINGTQKLIQFDNTGKFVKEEIDLNHEGDHQDVDQTDGGCECETGNSD